MIRDEEDEYHLLSLPKSLGLKVWMVTGDRCVRCSFRANDSVVYTMTL
jgi:hypothetical protein